MPNTIHFEGIAGSGKSTASERLALLLQQKGVDADWWLEEAAEHPVMPTKRKALHRTGNFPQLCLNAWRSFLMSQERSVTVLDGYAFQSTVRFLFEAQVSRKKITTYFDRWQEVAPDTSITYFFVSDLFEHSANTLAERGEEWAEKLYVWIAQTSVGKTCNLRGKTGFIEYWSMYQELCLELLASASIQVEMIDARTWNDQTLEALAVDRGLYPALRP